MKVLVLISLFLMVSSIGYTIGAIVVRRRDGDFLEDTDDEKTIGKWTGLCAALALIVVILLGKCWVVVGPAQTVAVYDPFRNGIVQHDYTEGWHLISPWAQARKYSKRLQEYTMSSKKWEGAVIGDDSMPCQTKEGLGVNMDATVIFRIPPDGAHRLWKAIGPEYLNIFVRPTTRNLAKLVVSEYGVMEVYSNSPTQPEGKPGFDYYLGKRQVIEDEIGGKLKDQFNAKGLEMVRFLLRDVVYGSKDFEATIVGKQIAQQQVTTQEYQAAINQIQAQAKSMRAEGEGRAIQLKGEALRADPRLIGLQWVEGLPPKGVEVVMLPEGSVMPMIHMYQQAAAASAPAADSARLAELEQDNSNKDAQLKEWHDWYVQQYGKEPGT